jgi:hypothetical protein
MEDKYRDMLKKAQAEDLEIWDKLLGQDVVVGFTNDNPFGIGVLIKNGTIFCEIENYAHYNTEVSALQQREYLGESYKLSPEYVLQSKIINKEGASSIQTLKDALKGNKLKNIFK